MNEKGRASRHIWFTRRAIFLHLTIAIVVPGFLALFIWQIERVRQGNTLSWAYVFEWPFFIGYAIYLWWFLIHEPARDSEPATESRPFGRRAERRRAKDEEAAAELEAYNRYLSDLDERDEPKRW